MQNFSFLRFLLLSLVVVSLVFPLSDHKLSFKSEEVNKSDLSDSKIISDAVYVENIEFGNSATVDIEEQFGLGQFIEDNSKYITLVYISISVLLLLRILTGLFIILGLYVTSEKEKKDGYIFIYHKKQYTFSFFKLIFIPKSIMDDGDLSNLLLHEKTHACQYHSIDIIIAELYACVFWFNPLVWSFKKQIKLIHEFIADDKVLKNGADLNKYQSEILSQIMNYPQFKLGSNYFYSIKKRIIMMSKTKNQKIGTFRILSLVLMFIASFMFVGYINAQEKNTTESSNPQKPLKANEKQVQKSGTNIENQEEVSTKSVKTKSEKGKKQNIDQSAIKPPITAMELPKMNIFYIGVDNPLKIAVSEIDNSELDVSITNGEITKKDGEYYNVIVHKPGATIVTVSHNGKILQQNEFRIRRVPDPLSPGYENCRIYSGKISVEEILRWPSTKFLYNYFDIGFDLETVLYKMIIVPHEKDPVMIFGQSHEFNETQLSLLKNLKSCDKIYFEDIIVADEHFNFKKIGAASFIIE